MVEQRSKWRENAAASRVEYLLGLLSALSQHDPPPTLRGRLELLASRRLRNEAESGRPLGRAQAGLILRLKPVFPVALLIVIGVAAAFVAHVRRPVPLQTKFEPQVIPPSAPVDSGIRAQSAAPSPEATLPATRPALPKLAHYNISQRMTLQLPYSDPTIDTGTDATIRVSMSQAELASLGFPLNTTLHDQRVIAELTLGDDGLPRAISVSLPLEVIKEKK